jgi:Concanavalin A-like lectin/glucanases superfamily
VHRRCCDIGVTVEPPGELDRRVYSHVRVFSSSWSVGRRLCAASAVVVLAALTGITCAGAHPAVDAAGPVSSYETATRALDSTVEATTRKGYDSGVLADLPVAYWRLGEASGSAVADSSGNGNSGRYAGNVRLAGPALIKGTSRSARFDGKDSAGMYFPPSASLQASRELSLEAWVRPRVVPTASGSGWHLLAIWQKALLYIEGGSEPRFVFSLYGQDGQASSNVVSTTRVAAGRTYYVVGTYDGSKTRIYVNGVLDATIARSGPVARSSLGGGVASGGWGRRPSPAFVGLLDDIAIYQHPLSSSRVKLHYIEARRS